MEELWHILKQILLVIQLLTALVGCFYFFRLKHTYWKWFAVYLIIIFIQELLLTHILTIPTNTKQFYMLFLGYPLEFIFLYWLYARKSLNRKRLFLFCSIIYLTISFISAYIHTLFSINFNVGTLLLTFLVILEYLKQIKNEDILRFQENKMFYINLGVILFYVGTLPFHVFQKYLYTDYQTVVEYYYVYFLIANCIMYLLFAASFIWGEEDS